MAEKTVRIARIVSKVKGEKGKGVGVIFEGRYAHNHSLVLGVREQNEAGTWETDKAVSITFASGAVLDLTAKDHFLNVYMADEYQVSPREESEGEGGPDGF